MCFCCCCCIYIPLIHSQTHSGLLSLLYHCREFFSYSSHMCRVFHLLHHANIWHLPYCVVLYSRCNFCFGTRVNKMGAMAWNSSYSQAYTRFDICCNVQLFLRHTLYFWSLFLGSILSDETEPVHSPLFTSIIVKWFIIFYLFLSLPNRLLHSDFHIGRCAGECDGVSTRAESPQGDRPGARHGVDRGLHW